MNWLQTLLGGATASLAGNAVGAVVGGAALTAGLAFAIPWLTKNLPPLVSKFAKKALDVLDWDTGDPVIDRAIDKAILAIVVAAEKKWPDRGEGKAKKAWALKKVLGIFPVLAKHEEKLQLLIEEVASRVDEEMDTFIAESDA